jgi:hypothetical protein
MPDLTPDLLPLLHQRRLPGLDLGQDFLLPAYNGYSILNLPSSLCQYLGAEGIGAGPLADELLVRLGAGRRVLLILMDALPLQHLRRWMADGSAPVWNTLAQQGFLAPLTSVVPSTTSAALTSLWTGRSPAEHGVAGYELWLKEFGVVANMLQHSPMSFQGDPGSLARAGFNPETFLPFQTLGAHLAAQGEQVFVHQHYSISRSSLSQMLFNKKDVAVQAFGTASDLWVNLRHLFESRAGERLFAWVYWGEVDAFSHRYGPDDERTAAEFAAFSIAFERLFLGRLSPAARKDTLVVLLADHGQVPTFPDPHYDLRSHPGLARRLHILPTGEHRLMYLFIRPGQTEAVREYLERTWLNQFAVLDPGYAVEAGLFGPGAPHPRLLDRLGDSIVLARGNAYLWWGDKDDHLYGRHGGLHPDEMLVPFLAVNLS